ncbi:hypothetical protein [Actinophytocola sp.]|uniref:hypothetical protein n=1 Tax=Actinophytocola sp. TaxID=1872138 RepID=UPI003D6C362A
MVTELPVRIEFRLPEGWQAAPPDEVGAPGVAFVALHPASANGFTANMTIAGQVRDPELTMVDIADESVRRLEETASSVQVRKRVEVGSAQAPGITQVLDITLGAEQEIVQCQVYVSMHDVEDPERRAVLEFMLTCTEAQLDDVFEDFQEFVRTVRAAEPGQ